MAGQLDERGDPVSATHDANRTKFSARETRQAGMGARVLIVLAASLLLALLVWAAVEWAPSSGNDIATGTGEAQRQSDTDRRPSTESPQGLAPTDRNPTPQSGSGAPRENTAPDDINR